MQKIIDIIKTIFMMIGTVAVLIASIISGYVLAVLSIIFIVGTIIYQFIKLKREDFK